MSNTKRKVTYRLGENERKIDFVLMRKQHCCWCLQNVKAIPGQF